MLKANTMVQSFREHQRAGDRHPLARIRRKHEFNAEAAGGRLRSRAMQARYRNGTGGNPLVRTVVYEPKIIKRSNGSISIGVLAGKDLVQATAEHRRKD
jgi:hypothetical protein